MKKFIKAMRDLKEVPSVYNPKLVYEPTENKYFVTYTFSPREIFSRGMEVIC